MWIRTSGISTPTPPTAPTNASATAMSSTQVDVTWVDNSFDEQDFQLQRSTDGVSFSALATLAPNTQSYSDTSVVGDTTYYYRVRATNTAGLSSWANTGAVTTPGAGTSDATANGETSISSSVSGSYLDTTTLNGVEEGLRELRTGGPPSQRVSYLEHEWTFNVAAGSSVSFHARAWHSNSSDDDFTLSWSSDGVNFQSMMTITATSDPGTYNVFTLPAGTSGTVYVRAEDTDRTPGNGDRDTLFIDHMFIRTQ